MVINGSKTKVVSHLGRVDKDNVWCLELETKRISMDTLSSRPCWITRAHGEHFMVRYGDSPEGSSEWSLHHFNKPSVIQASMRVTPNTLAFDGHEELWRCFSLCTILYESESAKLVVVDGVERRMLTRTLDWYNEARSGEGIAGVIAIPNRTLVAFWERYGERFWIYDYATEQIASEVQLGSGQPNPIIRVSPSGQQLWVMVGNRIDILGVDSTTPLAQVSVNGSNSSAAGSFQGQFSDDQRDFVVIRPTRREALGISTNRFRAEWAVAFDGTPLEVLPINEFEIIARERETGRLLHRLDYQCLKT